METEGDWGGLTPEREKLSNVLEELESFARGVYAEIGLTVDGTDAPEEIISNYTTLNNQELFEAADEVLTLCRQIDTVNAHEYIDRLGALLYVLRVRLNSS